MCPPQKEIATSGSRRLAGIVCVQAFPLLGEIRSVNACSPRTAASRPVGMARVASGVLPFYSAVVPRSGSPRFAERSGPRSPDVRRVLSCVEPPAWTIRKAARRRPRRSALPSNVAMGRVADEQTARGAAGSRCTRRRTFGVEAGVQHVGTRRCRAAWAVAGDAASHHPAGRDARLPARLRAIHVRVIMRR